MKPWHFGNTTVRSPLRLRDLLVALTETPIEGSLRGRTGDSALRNLLGHANIVKLGEDETVSVGRKWRSALEKLGFLYPPATGTTISQADVGPLDAITPNGERLVKAQNVPAMQECFLRALAAYYIPSEGRKGKRFSPLRHTLAVMLALEDDTGDSRLNFIEMALMVQLCTSSQSPTEVVTRIQEFRRSRESAKNKRRFDGAQLEKAAKRHKLVAQTFNDYADTNFRYLKATGLVHSKGRGITLVPEKRLLTEKLISEEKLPRDDRAYFAALCNGADLPTDNKPSALAVLEDLVQKLKDQGITPPMPDAPIDSVANIAAVRHRYEELLFQRKEESFAKQQAVDWTTIATLMDLLASRKYSGKLSDGEEINFPKNEAAAYLEWTLWRAFLAINSLVNKPYHSRRFNIDQDFLPVGPAPGNGPDMMFEFADFVLVVEVTLLDGSRQEAAEGETVRRHVGEILSQHKTSTGEPVYGLFVAPNVNRNTSDTFRKAVYWKGEDELPLDIVPLTLNQFKDLFESLLTHNNKTEVSRLRALIQDCGDGRAGLSTPLWEKRIQERLTAAIDI